MKLLYQIVIFRIIISVSRYLIFNFIGKFKTLYDPNDKVKNIITYETGKSGLGHNLVYRRLPVKFNLKGTYI